MSTNLNEIRSEPVNIETSLRNVDNPLLNESKEQSNEINPFPRKKFIWCIVSNVALCLLYYFDIISDILVMIQYFKEERYLYFGFTLLFVVIPWLLNIFISLALGEKRITILILLVFFNPFSALIK